MLFAKLKHCLILYIFTANWKLSLFIWTVCWFHAWMVLPEMDVKIANDGQTVCKQHPTHSGGGLSASRVTVSSQFIWGCLHDLSRRSRSSRFQERALVFGLNQAQLDWAGVTSGGNVKSIHGWLYVYMYTARAIYLDTERRAKPDLNQCYWSAVYLSDMSVRHHH